MDDLKGRLDDPGARREAEQLGSELEAMKARFDEVSAEVDRLQDEEPGVRERMQQIAGKHDTLAGQAAERERQGLVARDELLVVADERMTGPIAALVEAVGAYQREPGEESYGRYQDAERAYLLALRDHLP
jgi:predicted nuclease with TOPRIM domain